MMKMLLYVGGGLLLVGIGYWLGYTQCENNLPVLKCDDKEMLVQLCADTSGVNFGGEPAEDGNLRELYVQSFKNGDSIGFSLDRRLITELIVEIASNTSYGGFHLFPGMDDSGDKFLIKIPLNSDGVELPDVGAKIKLDQTNNFLGPCPKWCGNDSRTVITSPTQ
ncbi:MAG: hypothetical protein IPN29_06830 [Saprospiraceae bacterium]|nr:hypothetical protein [Saprospiraceae bacterium]